MRTSLYNFSITIIRLLLPLVAKLSPKINLFYQGQKNLIAQIKPQVANNQQELFWVHCSSVGEFEQGLPVIELLKKNNPTWKVVVTFFSPSGYEAVDHEIIDFKFYLPIDTRRNAKAFIGAINPKMALFIKYEYWYHFLMALKKKSIATYSVSSIFRPTQAFFKWYGGWNRKMLQQFSYFMVQDQSSLKLINSIGLNNAQITGDTRFDRVFQLKEDTLRFPEIENFVIGKKVFIVGSLRPEDDEIIFPFIKAHPNYKFLVAPHDITEKHIKNIEKSIPSSVRHSSLKESDDKQVMIIDSIGKLSRLYRLANFAYVGGGFSDGIHNILEPAIYHIPIFFGNKYFKKYKEATDLVELGAAFPISDYKDLSEQLIKLEDKSEYATISSATKEYVNSNFGASKKVVHIINEQGYK